MATLLATGLWVRGRTDRHMWCSMSRWFLAEDPISAVQRAGFFWVMLIAMGSSRGGPLESAIERSHATHPHYIPNWPAGVVLRLLGPQGLVAVADFTWSAWVAVTLWVSVTAVRENCVTGPRERPWSHAVERLLLLPLAAGFATLHAVSFSLQDYEHQYHVVMYSLFALAVCGPRSRVTPRLVLLCLVHTYASAGVAKFLNAGDSWFRGDFLCRLLLRRVHVSLPWPLCVLLSWSTIASELGSLAALRDADSLFVRFTFIMIAVMFHVLNKALIGATFTGQIACFLLILNGTREEVRVPMTIVSSCQRRIAGCAGKEHMHY